jgi:hypothetical protein
MDETKALGIVSALANGVNPITGEVFPTDSVYQAPDIVRALYVAVRALDGGTRARGRDKAPNAGKPWSEEEDRRLLAEFDRGRPVAELAQAHARTSGSIHARLEMHGRLGPGSAQPSARRFRNYGASSKPAAEAPT